jgi:hypothetical protein
MGAKRNNPSTPVNPLAPKSLAAASAQAARQRASPSRIASTEVPLIPDNYNASGRSVDPHPERCPAAVGK